MNETEFVRQESASRDVIDVKRVYIDMAGDLAAGVMLSQIVYWHLPDKNGVSRLKVERDGHFWLVKSREDWWDECRVKPRQADRILLALRLAGLIVCEVHRFSGAPTTHIRLNWPAFLTSYENTLSRYNQTVKSDVTQNVISEIPQSVTSTLIETTTETTRDYSLSAAAQPIDESPHKPVKTPPREQDPRRKAPAIQCAKAINDGKWPPKALWDDIIRILGPTPDGPKLVKCRKEWIERGYNPNSWKWLTQWYATGIPPRSNGSQRYETVMEKNQRVIEKWLQEAKAEDGEQKNDWGDGCSIDGSVAEGSSDGTHPESVPIGSG